MIDDGEFGAVDVDFVFEGEFRAVDKFRLAKLFFIELSVDFGFGSRSDDGFDGDFSLDSGLGVMLGDPSVYIWVNFGGFD